MVPEPLTRRGHRNQALNNATRIKARDLIRPANPTASSTASVARFFSSSTTYVQRVRNAMSMHLENTQTTECLKTLKANTSNTNGQFFKMNQQLCFCYTYIDKTLCASDRSKVLESKLAPPAWHRIVMLACDESEHDLTLPTGERLTVQMVMMHGKLRVRHADGSRYDMNISLTPGLLYDTTAESLLSLLDLRLGTQNASPHE